MDVSCVPSLFLGVIQPTRHQDTNLDAGTASSGLVMLLNDSAVDVRRPPADGLLLNRDSGQLAVGQVILEMSRSRVSA